MVFVVLSEDFYGGGETVVRVFISKNEAEAYMRMYSEYWFRKYRRHIDMRMMEMEIAKRAVLDKSCKTQDFDENGCLIKE